MKNDEEKKNSKAVTSLPGIALLGLLVTGALGIGHMFYSGDALGLMAAALSFGVVAIVSFI